LQGRLAPDSERVEENLGVARSEKCDTLRLEFATKIAKVVDFAIEDQAVTRRGVAHRLVSGLRQVHDRKPAKPEARDRATIVPQGQLFVALVVRSAVRHRTHHFSDSLFDRKGYPGDASAYAAHRSRSLPGGAT